ncbi:MAG TPA: IS481 family transposase [Candidatus Eremiobacteraceae bacterium]|nr:IS481 family transposase [Candidatus Eremiobacteraceae bacterium]
MHYTTRWDAAAIRADIVADRRAGMLVRAIQAKYQVSKHTVYRWLRRDSVQSRSSRPRRQPRRLTPEIEQRIIAARQARRIGPNRLAFELHMAPSTVYKVLKRYGINRLASKDRLPVVRYEHTTPGALIHVDVKKLGTLGLYDDPHRRRRGPGYECLHVAIDDCTRIGYAEIHPNELAGTSTGFLERAQQWFASIGIGAQRIMTDRGPCYTSAYWRDTCQLLGMRHILIRPRRPQTNGKVERWIRTITDEALKGRAYGTLEARADALTNYVNYYNTERPHTAIGGRTPFQRLAEKSTPGL